MKLTKQITGVVLGIIILHIGVALTMRAEIGIGGYDALGVTFSYLTNISVGVMYMIMAGITLVYQIIAEGKSFRIVEHFQWLFVFGSGIVVEGILALGLENLVVTAYFWKIVLFVTAVCVKSFGIMMIMETMLMRIPLEGMCFLMCQGKKITLGTMRMIWDAIFLIVGIALTLIFNLPYAVGVGTIIALCVQGPMMDVFKKPIAKIYKVIGITE